MGMFMKKFSKGLAVLLFVALVVLSGCSKSSTKDTANEATMAAATAEATAAPVKKVKIRILTRLASDQPNAVAFRDRVKQFQVENPNIEVEDLSIEDETSFGNKFKTSVANGDVPEIFANYGGAAFETYSQNGVAADLTEAMNADKPWADGFLSGMLENWRFADLKGTFGVPYEFYAVGVFYNKEIFAKVGVQVPKTIKEFEEVSKKLKAAGYVPMALGEKDAWRGGHLYCVLVDKALGAQAAVDVPSRKMKYNDPAIVNVMTLMQSWQKQGFLGDNIVSFDVNAEKNMFITEKSAMHMDGSWYVPEAGSSAIKDKIGFFAFPSMDDKPEFKDVWMGGAGGAISISGKAEGDKKEAAIKLLKYVTNADAFKFYQKVQKGGIFPVSFESDPANVDALTIEYSNAMKGATFKAELYSYDPLPQALDRVRNSVQGMFAGQTPEKAAQEIQDQIDKLTK
jgi:raffinose/stachyose/melibiose transport system substrate-binding protein